MRTFLLSALALGAMTTAALAEGPLTLTPDQMDQVTAGAAREPFFTPGAPEIVSPGRPAGGGAAEIARPHGDDSGRPRVVFTPGAPFTVFPGPP